MAAIETLFKITASVAGANAVTDLAQEIAKVSTQGELLSAKFAKVGTALKLFAVGEGASMFKDWIGGAIDTGVQLEQISQKTGVSVEMLGHLKGAAEVSGLSLEDLGNSLAKFDKAIISAQDGTGKQAAAFAFLGINVKDATGNLKPAEELFGELADKFHNSADGAGKTTLAIDLLGKSGSNLIPTLNLGKEAIQSLGLAVGTEFAEQAHESEMSMLRVKTQFEQAGITIASDLLPGLNSLMKGFGDNDAVVSALVITVKSLESAFVGLEQVGTTVTDYLGEKFLILATYVETFGKVISDLGDSKKEQADMEAGLGAIAVIRQAAIKKGEDDNAHYRATLDKIWGIGEEPKQAKKPEQAKKNLDGYNPSGAMKSAAESEKAENALEKWVTKQNEVNTSLQQEGDYIGKTAIEIEILKANRQLDAEAAEKSIGLTEDQKAAFMEEEAAVKESRDAILMHNYELSRMASTGAVDYLKKYTETATDSAAQVKTVLTTTFSGLENVFTNFVQTGKLSFTSLVNSILADLTRISIQRSITGPLSSALGSAFSGGGALSSIGSVFGFANGGVMTSGGSMPLNKYASGGIANSPQLAMFGEGQMNEAYVPLPDGRSIPVTMSGSGNGDGITINAIVNLAGNGTSTESTQGGDAKGQQLSRMIGAAIKATLIDEKRPGGLLAT